ncbi:outer membrane protein assembly factor BamC [Pleionea sediminis]|uniref:outer membrane protein assembly factor BamC n=1 Tax=Pleionea sediminis TaxID=2569479 RepID=UPI0011859A9F|nr:outer membrane protein assembly factor BamC [Pleionea sediminis]
MKYLWVFLVASTSLLSGCSWLYGEDGLIHDSTNDYLKAKQSRSLEIPEDYDKSRLSNELPVPPLSSQARKNKAGEELDRMPPIQILAVSQGMRVNRAANNPAVFWLKDKAELKQQIEQFFNYKNVSINNVGTDIQTDWVVEDNEAWWRAVFGTVLPRFERSKYRINLAEGERKGEVSIEVQHIQYQRMPYEEDKWIKLPTSEKIATRFLNEFVGYMDYLDRLENAKMLQQMRRGFVVKLAKDANNNAALLAESDWRTVWLKTPKILEPFGFTLTDKDRAQSTYFFNFVPNEPGFFASMFGGEEGVALDLEEGPYQVIVGGRDEGAVTVSFVDVDGNPLSDGKMAKIFPYLSEAYGRTERVKKR